MKKKILIIGGTGFIGSHLIRRLKQKKKFIIFCISKKKSFYDKNIKQIIVDVNNIKLLKKKFKNQNKFDYVINLGGYIKHGSIYDKGIETFYDHVNSLMNIITIISTKNLKKFIQIGSSAEYGLNKSSSEFTRENPLSFYSAGKLAASHLSQVLFKQSKIPVTVLRFFQVYGPEQKNDRLLPYVINSCLKNKKFNLTKCEHIRDFCFIDDIIDSILLCLKNKKTNGEIYNVGSGKGVKLSKIVKLIHKIIGKGFPKFGGIPYQKIENMKLIANFNKFKRDTKWKPKVSLHNGLKKTINYYKRF